MTQHPAGYWRTYARPNPDQDRLQKRAWQRALSKLRRAHPDEFDKLYRAELVVEERRREAEAVLAELERQAKG